MMAIRRKLITGFGATLFIVIMGSVGIAIGWYASQRPSIIVTSVREADGVAIRGGWMELNVTVNRTRLCKIDVDRWLWRENEQGQRVWVPLAHVASPPTELGVLTTYQVWLPVPGNIPTGKWHYLSRSRDDCTAAWLSSTTVRESPDVPVLVIDPTASEPAQIVVPAGPVTMMPLPAKQ